MSRRDAIKTTAAAATIGPAAVTHAARARTDDEPWFRISLAQWSLHRALQGGQLDHLDFPLIAKSTYAIDAVEYVNSFFKEKVTDEKYLAEMNRRCEGEGIRQLLIMCDGEGNIGDADAAKRTQTVANHHKWADAARTLGCHSIRVNAASSGTWDEQRDRAADGLRRLTEYAAKLDLNVIVENHGGLSSNGQWLAETIRAVDHPRCGTLPDFGNFCFDWNRSSDPDAWYDRYKGVREMMPFAKAVSAKSNDFDGHGDETQTDYTKMLRIVHDAGYRGYIGIEYEGKELSEHDGIVATKKLLERVQGKMG